MDAASARYLDLFKQVLTGEASPSAHDVPVDLLAPRAAAWKRFGYQWLAKPALDALGLSLTRRDPRYFPLGAYTLLPRRLLDHLQGLVEQVVADRIPGDLIEAGVWRGGACMLMKATLDAVGDARRVIVADSFAGVPPPRAAADRGHTFHEHPVLAVSADEVRRAFQRFGLLDDRVIFLEGWFSVTLAAAPATPLALVRVDADLHESTTQALEALYPLLSPGGVCIIDDYPIASARGAVDEFRARHGVTEPIQDPGCGGYGAWWRKAVPRDATHDARRNS